jgi:methyl-accepting chemotaxis protein
LRKTGKRGSGIKTRIVLQAGLSTLVIFALVVFVISIYFYRAQVDAAYNNMKHLTNEVAKEIDQLNSQAKVIVRLMADHQETGAFGSRESGMAFSRRILENNSFLLGVYYGYEAGADSADQDYINVPGHDSAGRYLPYWYRDNGQLALDPLVDMESSDYYMGPKTTGSLVMTEPYLYEGVMLLSIVEPVYINRNFVGIAGVDLGLDDVTGYLADFRPYETSNFYLLSRERIIIAAPLPGMIGLPAESYPFLSDLFGQIESSNGSTVINAVTENGDELFFSHAAIENGDWLLLMSVEQPEIMHPIIQLITLSSVIALIGLMVILVILYLMVHRSLQPLSGLVRSFKRIAAGDFTVETDVKRDDEIGQLSLAFNEMSQSLRVLISETVEMSTGVNSGSESVSAASEEMSSSLEEITASTSDFASNAENLSSSSQIMAETNARILERAEEGNSAILEAVEQMRVINTRVSELQLVITEVDRRSRDIGQILSVITDIADQTNLLALNAAIEAARAGEQGRGFAVVAEEVRKLAEQSAKAATEIGEMISSSQEESQKALESMTLGVKDVEAGTEVVARTGNTFTEILQDVSSISKQVEETASAAQELSAGSEEMAASIEEQSSTMEEMAATAEELRASAERLFQELQKFKYK